MAQGLVLLVIGMATVFAFLVLLVVAMQASAAFFKKYAHLFPEELVKKTTAPATNPAAVIAVALAAIRAQKG